MYVVCQWKRDWCKTWFVNGNGGGAGVKLGLLMEKGLVYIKKNGSCSQKTGSCRLM